MKINKEENTPLYSQLVDLLIEEISFMQPGDKLPSERQLCDIYDISRTTVRQAISELELNGFVERYHGSGTFVSNRDTKKHNLSEYYSFTDQMKAIGKIPNTIVLEFHIERSNKLIAEKLHLKEKSEVIRFVRLREADGVPLMIETTYIPYEGFSKIDYSLLSRKPLYDIFDNILNRKISHVSESFQAGILGMEEAKALNVQEGASCLRIKRYTYDTENKIIEYTLSFARGDQFAYKVSYKRVK